MNRRDFQKNPGVVIGDSLDTRHRQGTPENGKPVASESAYRGSNLWWQPTLFRY